MNSTQRTQHAVTLLAAALAVVSLPSSVAATPSGLQSAPFAARSGPGERMMFTSIPAAEAGLLTDNAYDDPDMWGEHYTEFQGGAIGTGIAAGDVDGDGLVDLYVVNKNRPNQLFRQVAPFRFEDISARAGVPGGTTWSTGATFADVDNDGDLDLYACQFNAPNLLYLNDGHGAFTEAGHSSGVDLVSGSAVGAFEDYDRDGDLDLFVVTNLQNATMRSEGEPDRLYRNRGDGSFEEVTESAGIAPLRERGHSATWFDANDDGWADLYIANDFSAPDHLYRNNGDGTFTEITETALPHTPWFCMGSDASDINNDGLFDLFVADMAGTTHFKSKVTMGDMGGLVDFMDTLVCPQYMKNAVFINSGADRFMEAAKLTGLGSSDWTWSSRFEDLDNDGWVDLHVTNGMVRSFTDSDMLNRIKKLTSQRDIVALVRSSPPLADANLTYRNDGNLRFERVQASWGLEHEGVSFGSAFADLDNDGDLDLVYANYDDAVRLYRNDSPSGARVIVALRGTQSNSHGVGAQAFIRTAGGGIQTRRITVSRGALSSSEPVMHFGLGAADRVESLEIRWPSGAVQKFEDLAVNARYTVVEPKGEARPGLAVKSRQLGDGIYSEMAAGRGLDFTGTERVYNDMKRQSLLPHRMNTLGGGIAWGDVDADGDADVYFAGPAGMAGALYHNDGTGHFTREANPQPWDGNAELEEMAPVWLDVDHDGDLDLVVTVGSVEVDAGSESLRDVMYLNNGDGSFVQADASRLQTRPVSTATAAAADFDRDGDLDLFVGGRVIAGDYPRAPESMLLENRDGALVDVTDTLLPIVRTCGMVTAALWTDADGDGLLDLLIAGEWMTPRLFHNTGSGFSEATCGSGLDEQSGWWNSLAAADVDRDGDMDYVAGNVGLNTKYHASPDHPVQIHYGDFEGVGKCEIVESEYEGDRLFPVRGRSCSSRAMPSLKEKFPTFRDWGTALLPEIYPEEKLVASLHVLATQLASGVFINDGAGHFEFRALPRLAQISPVYGVAAVDANGDGNVDLFLAQNFNGPQVETGRYDGGVSLLLMGDGRGNFEAVAPARSGIAIVGEGRGVTTTDLDSDGWADLVVTRSNGAVMAYGNRKVAGGNSFAVKLDGARGNPDAVGARVVLRFADGSTQAAEVHAGAGYLSQSEPLVFFGYAGDRVPRTLEITWPDGVKQSQPFEPGNPRISVQQREISAVAGASAGGSEPDA